MVIVVKVLEWNKLVEIPEKEIKVRDLLKALGLMESEHLVLKNGVVVPEDDVLRDGDEVVIFTVKSGG